MILFWREEKEKLFTLWIIYYFKASILVVRLVHCENSVLNLDSQRFGDLWRGWSPSVSALDVSALCIKVVKIFTFMVCVFYHSKNWPLISYMYMCVCVSVHTCTFYAMHILGFNGASHFLFTIGIHYFQLDAHKGMSCLQTNPNTRKYHLWDIFQRATDMGFKDSGHHSDLADRLLGISPRGSA